MYKHGINILFINPSYPTSHKHIYSSLPFVMKRAMNIILHKQINGLATTNITQYSPSLQIISLIHATNHKINSVHSITII